MHTFIMNETTVKLPITLLAINTKLSKTLRVRCTKALTLILSIKPSLLP